MLNPYSLQEEYGYLVDLAPLTAPALIASAYNTLLNPVLVLFSTTVTSLIAFIKRSLHKHTFLALSSYESLAALQTRWDRLLSRRGAEKRKDSNELKDGLHALRAVCLRSFPEFLADLRMASMGKGANMSTGLADFTTSVRGARSMAKPEVLTRHAHYRSCNTWIGCLRCKRRSALRW